MVYLSIIWVSFVLTVPNSIVETPWWYFVFGVGLVAENRQGDMAFPLM